MSNYKEILGSPHPIYSWAPDLDEATLEQARHVASLPFVYKGVCLMPDAHKGYGMPIGGVVALTGHIIPNAIGNDIGCGMLIYNLGVNKAFDDIITLNKIVEEAKAQIPMGREAHPTAIFDIPQIDSTEIVTSNRDTAYLQMGTLGGGNHFIEIQKELTTQNVLLVIHSGSRGLGGRVAEHYRKLASKSKVPKEWDLGYISVNSNEGFDYIKDATYCTYYAMGNRKSILIQMVRIIQEVTNSKISTKSAVDIPHNFLEQKEGKWIHRKGAAKASKGQICFIPGGTGQKSIFGIGKGNLDSFESCSHGSGRRLSRTQCKQFLNWEDERTRLFGIVHRLTLADLDECPGAYKNIDSVMASQKDLVSPNTYSRPLAIIK